MKLTPRRLQLLLNMYPPYWFTGIRVISVDPEWRELQVSMRLRWFNRNAVGTHFGGSLYSMVDPHVMLLLIQVLGEKYVVWDQSARIEFHKPGRGRVRSIIRISDEVIDEIIDKTKGGAVHRPQFELEIVNDDEETVATVSKILYVRERRVARSP